MNAHPSLEPEMVVFCSKMGPLPALASAQMNSEMNAIGTITDLAQKKALSFVG